jgi:hypothetical protein
MDHITKMVLLVAQDYTMLCLKQLSPEEYVERCNAIQEQIPAEEVSEFLKRLPEALDAGGAVATAKLALAAETENAFDALYVPADHMQWPVSLITAVRGSPELQARLNAPAPTLQ